MPKRTRKPVIATLEPKVVVEARTEEVRGGQYNPKEIAIDKAVSPR